MIPLLKWVMRYRLRRRLPPVESVRSVVVLCTANRVRSPFAEVMLRRALPVGVTVISRGVLKGGGRCPGEAIDAAQVYEVNLTAHRARQLAADELLQADLVLTMELRMAHDLVTQYPSIAHKVAPLRTFDPQGGLVSDIEDPYMLPPSEYTIAYNIIARCCMALGAQFPTGDRL
jgi:protein-tyrosine-phosphatase